MFNLEFIVFRPLPSFVTSLILLYSLLSSSILSLPSFVTSLILLYSLSYPPLQSLLSSSIVSLILLYSISYPPLQSLLSSTVFSCPLLLVRSLSRINDNTTFYAFSYIYYYPILRKKNSYIYKFLYVIAAYIKNAKLFITRKNYFILLFSTLYF